MDDPALPAADHMHALDALARINMLSLTSSQVVRAISRMHAGRGPHQPSAGHNGRPFQVVDVACGGGDVTVAVERRLSRNVAGGISGRCPAVVGIDISPRAIVRAEKLAGDRASSARFQTHDVLRDGCPSCDVAVSSLFLHHLDDTAAVVLLRHMAAAARLGVVISDLIRSRVGLALAVLGTRVLSSSRVARVDGPLSVRAARTLPEYHHMLAVAGMTNATIRRTWPERALIVWRRPDAAAGIAP
jgi:SAM-dependent methyltransferase